MSDNTVLKAERDFTEECNKLIPEAEKLGLSDAQGAIDKLLVLEKQARQASDLPSTSRILEAIITIPKKNGDWKLLNEQIIALSKKHGQLKQAITKMVRVAMTFLDATPTQDVKLNLIDTLRTVTEGKIFVEVERARVTRILSDIRKSHGDINSACDILCELQVETFGSMDRPEKTEFILEQVELSLAKGDWTQASVLSRKIGTKLFARKTPSGIEKLNKQKEEYEKERGPGDPSVSEKFPDTTHLKLRYYDLLIQIAKHDFRYLDVCKYYRQVLDTESVENNTAQLRATLERIIYYLVLSPFDNEQSDLLYRIRADSRIKIVPEAARLLKQFTIQELMRWPVAAQEYGPTLCSTDVFSDKPSTTISAAEDAPYRRWQDLRKRVIEHNVRVVAKYYARITTGRLCELLDLSEEETEKCISDLVTSKTVYAKIDRPARLVNFAKPRDANDILNEWSGNMKSLLGHLEKIDHLITKEEMMARIMPTAKNSGDTAQGAATA